MGKEYFIKCPKLDTQVTRQFLEQHFIVAATDNETFTLSLRDTVAEPASSWAPVVVALESDGVYFLDNLASPYQAANIFMQLVDFLLLRAEEITITEP
jgi:protein associated with RNAse G/E